MKECAGFMSIVKISKWMFYAIRHRMGKENVKQGSSMKDNATMSNDVVKIYHKKADRQTGSA
jgi:hypothetical protein